MLPVELPTELIIIVLSHLPLVSIAVLQRVDRQWHQFLDQNQSSLYRNAAWREGWLASTKTLLEELDYPEEAMRRRSCYSRRAMHGVKDWKDFCRRRKMIQQSWAGRAPSAILSSPRTVSTPLPPNVRQRTPYRRVHRIKVDEKVGIVMTTSAIGGLVVRDLETDEVLWELPTWYVPGHAHLEYSEGYVIFDRDDGNKEVWRRTEDINELPALVTSFPDTRQLQMGAKMSTTSPSCPRAQFSPHGLFLMPEHTRAYRFLFPTLLVSSLERAFLWDIRTGEMAQTLDGIQVVVPFGENEAQARQEDQAPDSDANGAVTTMLAAQQGDQIVPDDGSGKTSYHSDSEPEAAPAASDVPDLPEPLDIAFESDTDDDDDDDDADAHPEFLGLIRYVELSERHVIIVGRYLLRVFSRTTGKPVLDVPSTMARYGAARWEVRSQEWVAEEDRKGKGKGKADDYEQAKWEGREVVRTPLEFSYEAYRRSSKLLIDQFVAAHVSSDGNHLVAMLSGSRIIVIHYFEALCDIIVNIASVAPSDFVSILAAMPRHSTAAAESSPSTPSNPTSSSTTRTTSRYALSPAQIRDARRRLKREKDKAMFEHTLDIQLGPPQASSSIYLAYENGRIGVVTTNAIYIITADLPPFPPSHRSLQVSGSIPGVRVARIPYFSHPSWLTAVSCLMMSDTGLYLNWNPSSPPPPPLPPAESDDSDEDMHSDPASNGSAQKPWYTKVEEGHIRAYRTQQVRMWTEWENEYEWALELYEHNADDRYHELPDGDMLVPQATRVIESSEVSTVYSVDFSVGDVGNPTPRSPS